MLIMQEITATFYLTRFDQILQENILAVFFVRSVHDFISLTRKVSSLV